MCVCVCVCVLLLSSLTEEEVRPVVLQCRGVAHRYLLLTAQLQGILHFEAKMQTLLS